MQKRNDNYFIGITLPDELNRIVESERKWMRVNCGCSSGMKTAPHITLIPPFFSSFGDEYLRYIFSRFTFPSFCLHVSGHSSFGHRTIFVNVEKSKELTKLKNDITQILRREKIEIKNEKNFNPHITIANRDIEEKYFIPSMEYLNDDKIDITFEVSSFMLFTRKDYLWVNDGKNSVIFSS